MLILTRKAGETVYIGEDIAVTVLKASRGQLSIGITAPKVIPVVREELVPSSTGAPAVCLPPNDSAGTTKMRLPPAPAYVQTRIAYLRSAKAAVSRSLAFLRMR